MVAQCAQVGGNDMLEAVSVRTPQRPLCMRLERSRESLQHYFVYPP